MLRLHVTDYDSFKAAFDALGGSRKTTVGYQSAPGNFRIGAAFPDNVGLEAGLQFAITTTPSTLATDFPQAVEVADIDLG